MDAEEFLVFIFMMVVVGVPVLGFTARFALQPVVEALFRLVQSREPAGNQEELRAIHSRLVALQSQMLEVQSEVERMRQTSEFDQELRRSAYGQPALGQGSEAK